MSITASGNVGIGLTAPATKLHVESNETHTDNHFTTADKGIVVGSSTTLGEGLALWHRGDGSDVIGSLYDSAGVGLNFINRASSSGNAVVALSLVNGNATFAGTVTSQNPKFMVTNAPKPASSASVVLFATEKFDIGSGFNTTLGEYTAPKAGYYYFSWWANHTRRVDLHLSYRAQASGGWSNVALSQNNTDAVDLGWVTAGRGALWYMAEGAQVRILCDSLDNGATTGWDTGEWNGFSGFMIP